MAGTFLRELFVMDFDLMRRLCRPGIERWRKFVTSQADLQQRLHFPPPAR